MLKQKVTKCWHLSRTRPSRRLYTRASDLQRTRVILPRVPLRPVRPLNKAPIPKGSGAVFQALSFFFRDALRCQLAAHCQHSSRNVPVCRYQALLLRLHSSPCFPLSKAQPMCIIGSSRKSLRADGQCATPPALHSGSRPRSSSPRKPRVTLHLAHTHPVRWQISTGC